MTSTPSGQSSKKRLPQAPTSFANPMSLNGGAHRFVAAGAAVRMALAQKRKLGGIVALDVALRRNATPGSATYLPTSKARWRW